MYNPQQLIQDVCKLFRLTSEELLSHRRTKLATEVRSLLVKTFRNDWQMSYNAIGKVLDRDHKTIMYLFQRQPSKTFIIPKNALEKALK